MPTLHDQLLQWDTARLERLLTLRPDLIEERSLEQIALTAGRVGSLYAALRDLPAGPRQVLEAASLLSGPFTVADLAALDLDSDAGLLARVVEDLCDRLLLLPHVGGWTVAGPVRQYLPHPLGLGRGIVACLEHTGYYDLVNLVEAYGGARPRSGLAAKQALRDALCDPAALSESLSDLPEDVLAVLRRADVEGPVLKVPGVDPFTGQLPDDPGVRGALLIGLVAAVGVGRVELPLEVGLALRWPAVTCWGLTPAPVPGTQAHQVAPACAQQVDDLLGLLDAVVGALTIRPLPLLSSGTVGVKEVRGLAAGRGDAAAAAYALRILNDLQLLTSTRKELRLLAVAKSWVGQPAATRWLEVVRVWLASSSLPPARAGGPRPLKPALSWDDDQRSALLRRQVVRLLGTSQELAYDEVGWLELWARRWPEDRLSATDSRGHVPDRDLRADVLHEAQLLGLVADGAASPLARAVYGGEDVAAVLDSLGDQGQQAVRAQADMTLVCTGRPARSMKRALDRVAALEQSGQATVWRVSEQSLATAYDEGDTPAAVLAMLERYAGEVPQSMAYLVGDAHRRHGQVRVGTATSYVVVADDAMLQDTLAKKGAKALGLTRIAPGVAVSMLTATATVTALRALGLAAVAEGARAAPAPRTAKAPSRARPLPALPELDPTSRARERAAGLR